METASDPTIASRVDGSHWSQLRRRKVGQWGLAYLAGVFALMQGLDLVAAHFEWPPAVMRVAMIAAATGLPIALVLAWFHGERGEQHVTGVELAILIALLTVGGVALRWAAGSRDDLTAVAAAPTRPVVAVLPLENLGGEESFAAGLHDELISRLSLVQGIEVVSRTSTLAHRDGKLDARQIGSALGASHLLEGTVQRSGQRVRMHVQFIDARSDRHVFARTLQRDLTDVFEIQALIASEIAESLRVALTADERARLEHRPTAVAEAYEAYLAAREEMRQGSLKAAASQIEIALAADPGFIDAHALMTEVACVTHLETSSSKPPGDWATLARDHAAMLERLAPQHAMTDLAAGMVAYWLDEDIERGRVRLERASAAMPNEVEAINALVWIYSRLGHLDKVERLLDRLDQLEPGSRVSSLQRAWHAMREREYARAIAIIDASIGRAQGAERTIDMRGDRALWQFWATGDVEPLRRFVDSVAGTPIGAEWQVSLARRTGDDATAYALVAAFPEFARLSRFSPSGPRGMYLAVVVPPGERAPLLDRARAVLDRLAPDTSDHAALAIHRGWIEALGGDASAALARFEQAEAAMAREIDRLHYAGLAAWLAQGYALAGDADAAQRWLAVCLQAHGGCHAMDVRHDVLWRSVRADPRTETLLQRLEGDRP